MPHTVTTNQPIASAFVQEPPTTQRSHLGARVALRVATFIPFLLGLLLLSAGTWKYWQAWAWICSSIVPAAIFFAFLVKRAPEVMERRLQSKEEVAVQRNLVNLLKPLFIIALCLPGLDRRFGWSRKWLGAVPIWQSIAADLAVLAGVALAIWVIRVNEYASRTIRVEAGQPVISTGPYRWVRHPMYSGSVLMWAATSLALGSYVAWPAFAALLPFYVVRLLNEEKVLRVELAGYSEYCEHTEYRLIPFVW